MTTRRDTDPSNLSEKLVAESIWSPQSLELDDSEDVINDLSGRRYLPAKIRLFQPGRFFRWVGLPWLEARFESFVVCESDRTLNRSIKPTFSVRNCI